MTGYEETLLSRAEMLEDTGELVQTVTAVLAGAQGAGIDPAAVTSLQAAAWALDPAPAPTTTRAASRTGAPAAGTAPTASSSKRSAKPKTTSGTGSGTWTNSRAR
jgi:hypothetical protein